MEGGLPGGGPPEEDPYDWTTDSDYGGSTYVPWQTSDAENYISAFGGLPGYDEGDVTLLGTEGYLWNPFIAGYDKEGKPIYLTTSQFNEMMSVGEFGILYMSWRYYWRRRWWRRRWLLRRTRRRWWRWRAAVAAAVENLDTAATSQGKTLGDSPKYKGHGLTN